jgi:hypothetical protein
MNLYVRICRKKPWLDAAHRRISKRWSRERRIWDKKQWRKVLYTNEIQLEVGLTGPRMKVRRPPGTAFEEKYLEPTFAGEKRCIMFFAAFTHGCHSHLVAIRKRTENERTSRFDKLGFNSVQYVNQVFIPHVLPEYDRRGGMDIGLETVEDRVKYHTSNYTGKFGLMNRVQRMEWPANSPDLNPIENIWSWFKRRFRDQCLDFKGYPNTDQELIDLAQEVWENMPWQRVYKVIDSMPKRIVTVIRRHGGATKW